MKQSPIIRKAQAGFTLIELIVVIVILGILAATALPRMFDMSGQARLAKMQGALGSVRAASSSAHAQWLVNGGQLGCVAPCPITPGNGTQVVGEGLTIPMFAGYPDVVGDQMTDSTPASADAAIAAGAVSGIAIASGLTAGDYVLSTTTPAGAPSANTFMVVADAAHPRCRFWYIQGTQSAATATNMPVAAAPQIITTDLTLPNCS